MKWVGAQTNQIHRIVEQTMCKCIDRHFIEARTDTKCVQGLWVNNIRHRLARHLVGFSSWKINTDIGQLLKAKTNKQAKHYSLRDLNIFLIQFFNKIEKAFVGLSIQFQNGMNSFLPKYFGANPKRGGIIMVFDSNCSHSIIPPVPHLMSIT